MSAFLSLSVSFATLLYSCFRVPVAKHPNNNHYNDNNTQCTAIRERSKAVELWSGVAQYCLLVGNYNSATAILESLESPAIARLHATVSYYFCKTPAAAQIPLVLLFGKPRIYTSARSCSATCSLPCFPAGCTLCHPPRAIYVPQSTNRMRFNHVQQRFARRVTSQRGYKTQSIPRSGNRLLCVVDARDSLRGRGQLIWLQFT